MTTFDHLSHSGRWAERFVVTNADGGSDVDFAALDELLAETVHRETAAVFRELAQQYRADADTSPAPAVLTSLAVALERRGNTAAARAAHLAYRARRARRTQGLRYAELISRAAQRLHEAAAAQHHIPVRLLAVAEWLVLAAEVHAGQVPCDWCTEGTCPALVAARGVLGEATGTRGGEPS